VGTIIDIIRSSKGIISQLTILVPSLSRPPPSFIPHLCLPSHLLPSPLPPQLISAIISAAVPVNGDQGWTSFVMLILELQFVVWMGYYSDRNAGDAVAELAVCAGGGRATLGISQKGYFLRTTLVCSEHCHISSPCSLPSHSSPTVQSMVCSVFACLCAL